MLAAVATVSAFDRAANWRLLIYDSTCCVLMFEGIFVFRRVLVLMKTKSGLQTLSLIR